MCDKALHVAKNNGYQRGFASMVYKYLEKKTFGSGIKNENFSDKELDEELHKPIIKKTQENKSTLFLYRWYLRYWSYWYAIN